MGSRVWLTVGLAIVALALPASASATTWVVTNTADGPSTCPSATACTLRGAIAIASTGSGDDIVQVPAGHYSVNTNPIDVSNAMQIVGPAGAAVTTIDQGSPTIGILVIHNGASSVTIDGLTFTDGHDAFGGAIASQAGTLTLSNDVFTNNVTGPVGVSGEGGAVNVSGGAPTTLTVTNTTFSSNRAGGDGGGTLNSGTGLGGAIAFLSPGTLSVTDSTFTGNRAGGTGGTGNGSGEGNGGAIFADTSDGNHITLNIVRDAFDSNRAGGPGGDGSSSGEAGGGAISLSTDFGAVGTLNITDSTFTGNLAGGNGGSNSQSGSAEGGALQAVGSGGSTLLVTVERTTFSHNQSGGDGGAGQLSGQGLGGAADFGGAISSDSVFSVLDSTFDGNRGGGTAGAGNDSGQGVGGTIEGNLPTVVLTNDTLVGGVAGGMSGSGGNLGGGAGVKLKNTILANGIADTGSNCAAPITSFGHNIETANDCGLTAAGDRPNTVPALGALANNGGLTQTMALGAGSPAIDGGDNAGCPDTDQRGVLRPAGAACDIGAFEVATPGGATGAVSDVHATSAVLNGVALNPDFAPGTASFQYGTSAAYGSGVGSFAVPGLTRSQAVSVKVTGLKAKTTYHFRIAGTNGVGSGAGGDQSFTTSVGAVVSDIRFRPAKFAAQKGRGASLSKKGGATLSFHATEAGTASFTVQKPRRGFRSGKRCVAKRPHGKKKARRCTLYKNLGSFSATTAAGNNSFHFTGRVKRRPLHAGAYRLRVVEKDADGHNGPANTRAFRIVKP